MRKKDEAVNEEVREIMGDEDYISWSDQLWAEWQPVERIADDLEVPEDEIREIVEVIRESAPGVDEHTIFDRLQQLQKV
ncbi:MAG: hypothetical protein PUD20_02865 [bacterium]|nr:hypothetical protein [bacterium]